MIDNHVPTFYTKCHSISNEIAIPFHVPVLKKKKFKTRLIEILCNKPRNMFSVSKNSHIIVQQSGEASKRSHKTMMTVNYVFMHTEKSSCLNHRQKNKFNRQN